MTPKWLDLKVQLGSIITTLTVVVGLTVWAGDIKAEARNNTEEVNRLEQTVEQHTASITLLGTQFVTLNVTLNAISEQVTRNTVREEGILEAISAVQRDIVRLQTLVQSMGNL